VTDYVADVLAARGGDPDARDRLLAALWPRAYRLAASLLEDRDRDRAEDAAQDALVIVGTRLRTLNDPVAYPAWSARIVVNAVRTAMRRAARERRPLSAGTPPPFEDGSAARLDMLAALAALPRWLRVPLVLRYVDGLTSREIGTALGAPAATIRFRLALGRRRLAALLDATAPAAREEYV
jgi:RNA polymerase sigma-70 factor (ECF subfamily)